MIAIRIANDNLLAEIEEKLVPGGQRWELTWNDRVANEWSETFEDLDVAMARLALLVSEPVQTGELFFLQPPDTFARTWHQFMLGALR